MSSVHNNIDINMPNLTNMHDSYKQSLFSLVKPIILKILNKYVQTAIHPVGEQPCIFRPFET